MICAHCHRQTSGLCFLPNYPVCLACSDEAYRLAVERNALASAARPVFGRAYHVWLQDTIKDVPRGWRHDVRAGFGM